MAPSEPATFAPNLIHQHLHQQDLLWCWKRMPFVVRNVLKLYADQVVLAGGYIRSCITGEPISDIDLFCKNRMLAAFVAAKLAGVGEINGGVKVRQPKPGEPFSQAHSVLTASKEFTDAVYTTQNAYTVKLKGFPYPVQVINRWEFEKPEKAWEQFDYVISMAALWWEKTGVVGGVGTWHSSCHPDFYQDLAARRIQYIKPSRDEEAGGSFLRLLKYYQMGYRAPLATMAAVIATLVGGVEYVREDGTRESTLELISWDRLAKVLDGLLIQVDPNVDPDSIMFIPNSPNEFMLSHELPQDAREEPADAEEDSGTDEETGEVLEPA